MVLKMELQKIWKPKLLLIIAVMGLLFGFLFLEFPLNYFPNGHPALEQYQLMEDWRDKYGVEMDKEEYEDALEGLDASKGDEYAQQADGALFEYEMRYEKLKNDLADNLYTPAEQLRVWDIIQGEKRDGILPYEAMGNAMEYWRWVSVFVVLSVMVLLGPGITRDALTGVRRLQYTSKCGRRILKTQFFATLLSAVGIAALELLIFAVLYARLGTWHFWDNPINSFFYGDVYWFDLSFGQYLLSILLVIVLFTGSAGGIAFFLSCFSGNYISLMLKMIPAFFLLGAMGNACISYLFSFQNPLYQLTGVKGMEICVGLILLLLGAVLGFAALKYKSGIRDAG